MKYLYRISLLLFMICQVLLSYGQNIDNSFTANLKRIGFNGAGVSHIVVQKDSKVLVAGSFYTITGVNTNRLARLNPDGTVDTGFITDLRSDDQINAITLQEDGKILVAGYFDRYTADYKKYTLGLFRLNTDGSFDHTFQPSFTGNWIITALKLQADGKILVGWASKPYSYGDWQYRVARLTAEGEPDHTFNSTLPETNKQKIFDLGVQSDGKIIVAGENYGSTTSCLLKRLLPNGTEDTGFAEKVVVNGGESARPAINKISILATDEIVISGDFKKSNATKTDGLAKLNPDGSLNQAFTNPFIKTNGFADHLVLPNGKILLAGYTEMYMNGQVVYPRFLRLNADGSPDNLFPNLSGTGGGFASVECLAIDNQHTILLGSGINNFGGVTGGPIRRISQDGIIDLAFSIGPGAEGVSAVYHVAVQEDRQIIIGGAFEYIDGISRNNIARLNFDGSLDTSFDPGAGTDGPVYVTLRQPDGKILITGDFYHYNQKRTKNVVRLYPDGRLDESFNPDIKGQGNMYSLALQPDGKLLLTEMNPYASGRLFRLHPDGRLDESFTPYTQGRYQAVIHHNSKYAVLFPVGIQADGKILSQHLRFLPDGTLDTSFKASSYTKFVAVETDQSILMRGGSFVQGAEWDDGLHRVNPDGSINLLFNDSMQEDEVAALLMQPDGRFIVNAEKEYGTRSIPATYRLNNDGTFDESFTDLRWGIAEGQHILAYHTEELVLAGSTETSTGSPLRRYKIKKTQILNFPAIPDQTFDGNPIEITLTATSTTDVPIYYEVLSGPAQLQNNILTITGSGSISVRAYQAGNETYDPSSVSRTFYSKSHQQIGFPPIADIAVDAGSFIVDATSTSGLPVSLSLVEGSTGQVEINGTTLTLLKPGRVTLQATQPGNEQYFAALADSQSFCINPKQPVIRLEGGLLVSDSPLGNQWYRNGELLPNATLDSYQPVAEGLYTVRVSSGGCTSAAAEAISLQVATPVWAQEIAAETTEGEIVTLAWEPVVADALYTVMVSLQPDMANSSTIQTWQTSQGISGITNCTNYYFSVKATVNGISSGWSEVITTRGVSAFIPTVSVTEGMYACSGNTLTVSAPEGFVYYEWSEGSQEKNLKATKSGLYAVRVANTVGCWTKWSEPVALSFYESPEAFITREGAILTATEGANYQWLFNGQKLPGNTQSITAVEAGAYQVIITSAEGCTAVSNSIIIDSNLEGKSAGELAFGNAFSGKIQVNSAALIKQARLLNTNSELLLDMKVGEKEFKYDISSYPAGVYYIVVEMDTQVVHYKITKK